MIHFIQHQSIATNPHNYKIEELEAANLPNNLPDVDICSY